MAKTTSAIQIKAVTGVQEWGEFDGNCTLFNLEVGNNVQRQNFRFVPSTSSFTTWLPNLQGCNVNKSESPSTPSDQTKCAEQRGVGLYNGQQSGGFDGALSLSYNKSDIEYLDLGADLQPTEVFGLSYNKTGLSGFDYLTMETMDNGRPTLQSSNGTTIFGYATWDYFLATVGLGFGEWKSHLTTLTPIPSFMKSIADNFTIPSRSWGYTAGARYYNKGVGYPGSLVLGGYDAARIESGHTATFKMASTELLVEITSTVIEFNDQNPASRNQQFQAVIDSTLPYLFLPSDMCQWFADRYNLRWEPSTGLYFVNATTAAQNLLDTKDISFTLQDALGGDGQVTISFPYDAFDAWASWTWGMNFYQPIFPIRNQTGDKAVLGRAFLQQAYLSANYEPDVMKFNVSQTKFPADNTSNIISIQATPDKVISSGKKALSTGAIIGIAIGAATALFLTVLAVWWLIRQHSRKRQQEQDIKENDNSRDPDREPTSFPIFGDRPPHERRSTVGSNWSDNTIGRSEVGAATPASSPRPDHSRQLSELSSDSEHERRGNLLAILHEMPDKGDAVRLEEYEQMMKTGEGGGGVSALRTPRSPQEMEGSTDWLEPDRRG